MQTRITPNTDTFDFSLFELETNEQELIKLITILRYFTLFIAHQVSVILTNFGKLQDIIFFFSKNLISFCTSFFNFFQLLVFNIYSQRKKLNKMYARIRVYLAIHNTNKKTYLYKTVLQTVYS